MLPFLFLRQLPTGIQGLPRRGAVPPGPHEHSLLSAGFSRLLVRFFLRLGCVEITVTEGTRELAAFGYAVHSVRSRSCACDPLRSGASQVLPGRRSDYTGYSGQCRVECKIGGPSISPFSSMQRDTR